MKNVYAFLIILVFISCNQEKEIEFLSCNNTLLPLDDFIVIDTFNEENGDVMCECITIQAIYNNPDTPTQQFVFYHSVIGEECITIWKEPTIYDCSGKEMTDFQTYSELLQFVTPYKAMLGCPK